MIVLLALGLQSAAAFAFFSDMKSIALVCTLLAVAVLATGCTSGIAAKLNKLPDGRFATATLEETDKFTSTTIKLEGVAKDDGTLSAARMTIDHTNPWVTKFHYDVTDYYGQLSAAAKKKPLPPVPLKSLDVTPATPPAEIPKL